MKKTLFIILLAFVMVSCSTKDEENTAKNEEKTQKPTTKSIPSADKLVKEGTPFNSEYFGQPVFSIAGAAPEYYLLDRLYDTVWYQTEKKYDDARLRAETTFIFFDNKSWVAEKKMKNGYMEAVGEGDYSKLVFKYSPDETFSTKKKNGMIVELRRVDGVVEYQGYYLKDPYNLYMIKSDDMSIAGLELTCIMKQPNLPAHLDTEHYFLSTNSGK